MHKGVTLLSKSLSRVERQIRPNSVANVAPYASAVCKISAFGAVSGLVVVSC